MRLPRKLTAELLNALIDKILVHEAEVGPDGIRQQEVEIFLPLYWPFRRPIPQPFLYPRPGVFACVIPD